MRFPMFESQLSLSCQRKRYINAHIKKTRFPRHVNQHEIFKNLATKFKVTIFKINCHRVSPTKDFLQFRFQRRTLFHESGHRRVIKSCSRHHDIKTINVCCFFGATLEHLRSALLTMMRRIIMNHIVQEWMIAHMKGLGILNRDMQSA